MTRPDDLADRYAATLVSHRRLVIVGLLLVTAVLGSGLASLDGLELTEFDVESEAAQDMETVEATFERDDHPTTLVVVHGEETLAHESIFETMEVQRELRANETVDATLADDRSTGGVGNAMALAANLRLATADGNAIDEKIETLEDRSPEQLERDLELAFAADEVVPDGQPNTTTLLPTDVDPEERSADARLVVVVHDPAVDEEELLEAQRAIDDVVDERIETTEAFVFGQALAFDRGAQATGESFALVGPLALFAVVAVLAATYRDAVDVLLVLVGVALVLVWTGGAIGWMGLPVTQLLVAVPCLLVGLGVDHAFHVLTRYREERATGSHESAMRVGLASVIAAIGITTVTTVVGFLSGLGSPIVLLREFAVASAVGMVAALVVFGALLPALTLELEAHRNRRLQPLSRRPALERPLRRTATLARSAPVAIVVVALLLTLGGAYGFTHVDTATEREDFLPGEQPAWMAPLPDAIQPSDHALSAQATLLETRFDGLDDPQAEILIEGNVTDPETLEAIDEAERQLDDRLALATPADGRPPVYGPVDALEELATENESVADALEAADETGDGLPDTELEGVYDVAYDVDPDAMGAVVSRGEAGEYEAVLVTVAVDDGDLAPAELPLVAERISASPGVSATATGDPILEATRDQAIVETVFGTFLVAFVVIATLLTVLFRVRHGSWTDGPITVVPVLAALAWTVGTMTALSIPYNAETAIITGVGIGLGVDYAVHVCERYRQERRTAALEEALERTVVGTGGALLASVATTAIGFATLTLTLVPSLQRFGFITALVVVYAFVSSVVFLPALLVLRERLLERDE